MFITSRGWLNVILMAAVLGLAALIYFEPGSPPVEQRQRISDVDAAKVTRIRIAGDKLRDIEFENSAGGWRMLKPYDAPASLEQIQRILSIALTTSQRHDLPPNRLAEFGLAPAQVTVDLDDEHFSFGITEPINHLRYLTANDKVHLTVDRHLHTLKAAAESFIDKHLLGPGAQPKRFVLNGKIMAMQDNGSWTGLPEGADADAGNRFARRWSDSLATAVKAYAPQLSWKSEVIVNPGNNAEDIRFVVGYNDYELLFGRPELGIQYHMPRDSGLALLNLKDRTKP